MSLGNDLRTQAFEQVQLVWDGQTVTCNLGSFKALVEQQPMIDLTTDLGSDPREIVYIHVKDPPNIARGDVLVLEDGTQVTVIDRDNNPSNLVYRYTAVKIIEGVDQ